jgi:hypothetical protein
VKVITDFHLLSRFHCVVHLAVTFRRLRRLLADIP